MLRLARPNRCCRLEFNATFSSGFCLRICYGMFKLAKERSPSRLDERSTFVHCRASLQVVKRVSGRSQGNWRHLASECLKSPRAQKPIQQKVLVSSFEPSLKRSKDHDDHSATELPRWYCCSKDCSLCSWVAKTKIAAQKTCWDVLLLLANSGAAFHNEDMTLSY